MRVSQIALGTLTWGRGVTAETAGDLLRAYRDFGGNMIDTSVSYPGMEILGELIGQAPDRDELTITCKSGVRIEDGAPVPDASRGHLMRGLDAALTTLGTDHVDVWLLEAWDPRTPLDETLAALETAQRSGRATYVGLANAAGWQLAVAASTSPVPLVATEVEYSLLQRQADYEVLPAADYLRLGVFASSPLGRGVLSGKYRHGKPRDSRAALSAWSAFTDDYRDERSGRIVEAVSAAASGLNISLTEVALGWLTRQETVTSMITGARTETQLKEVLGSADVEVPDEVLDALDDVSTG
nr:aldo/keto reductase [Spelaeicoccus albus]